ncbi:MAG: hypothetical protein ACYDDU_20530 [Dermatophilaceae bacterium]
MRTRQRAAVPVHQGLARDRAEAHRDARDLAIELDRGVPSARFDPMRAGVVLQPGETVYRQVPLWIRVSQDGRWADATYADVIVTDVRLLCRMASGRLTSLWWSGVVGLHVDLAAEHIVLDFGDGQPVGLSGAQVASVAVVGIASVYGVEAMLTHPGLAPLRTHRHREQSFG